jgi:hypothetical protein
MTDDTLEAKRLRMLPPVRRARLWRLYAENGERYLDFWMDGGRSILGAKGTGIGTAAKAAIDSGLTRPFPSVREARLEKALLTAYPAYAAVRLYRDEGRARAAAARVSPNAPLATLRPFGELLGGEAYSAGKAGGELARIALPMLPCPAALAPSVLLFAAAEDAEAAGGDLVAPYSLGCAQRALYEFDRFRLTYNESLWKRADRRLGPHFERKGPYLFPLCEEGEYGAFFAAALAGGALISPRYEEPSIIPGDFDDGELKKLAETLGKKD